MTVADHSEYRVSKQVEVIVSGKLLIRCETFYVKVQLSQANCDRDDKVEVVRS